MTDITAAEYRTAEKVARSLGFVTAQSYADHAARLESEGAVPAGGMALTAEQVEDVEALVATANPYSAPAARLRALFPATEPAEMISRYQTMQRGFAAKHFGFPANPVFEDRYTAPDGGKWQWTDELQWELRCYPPAPAVPAEEETKAELCAVRLCVLPARHSGVHADREGLRWNNPASSPVVPAPTETGPWASLADVPENVEFRGTFGPDSFTETVWIKRDGVLWHSRPGKTVKECQRIASLAPFVAAAGEGDA